MTTSISNLNEYRRLKKAKKYLTQCEEVKKDLNIAMEILGKHTPANRNINKICQDMKSEVTLVQDLIDKFVLFIKKTEREQNGE
jgi:TusA-related sulfurtransferase